MKLDILHWNLVSSYQGPPTLKLKARYYDVRVSTIVNYDSSNRKLTFSNATLNELNLTDEQRETLVRETIASIRKIMLAEIGPMIAGMQQQIFDNLPREPK
jgi:hypothetical protein